MALPCKLHGAGGQQTLLQQPHVRRPRGSPHHSSWGVPDSRLQLPTDARVAGRLRCPLALHDPRSCPCCLSLRRYPPEALAAVPDPTANVFVERGIDTATALLQRLQRLGALLDQQRRAARAAARAADAAAAGDAAGDGAAAGTAAGAGAGGASACARPVRLLVVDSVAHVCRDMGDSVGAAQLAGRTETLFRLAALLRCAVWRAGGRRAGLRARECTGPAHLTSRLCAHQPPLHLLDSPLALAGAMPTRTAWRCCW